MIKVFKKSPAVKENCVGFRITILILSFISSIFILSPAIAFFIRKSSPLAEMPQNTMYYIFKLLFGIALISTVSVFFFAKKTAVLSIPAFLGFCTALYPLFQKIETYKQYNEFTTEFSMTADFTSYYVNIGIYALFTLLCLITLLYSSGLFPLSLIVTIFSVVTATAVVLITIDKAKNVQYEIFNIYDILCFTYAFFASLIPAFIVLSTRKAAKDTADKPRNKRYKPKRMRT